MVRHFSVVYLKITPCPTGLLPLLREWAILLVVKSIRTICLKARERNLNITSTRRSFNPALSAILCLFFATLVNVGFGQTDDSVDKIKTEQEQLAERYKQLEEKLFSLSKFEESSNPDRSKLLQKAFLQSQEQMTNVQLDRAVKMINDGKYKDAEKMQNEALSNMTEMLKLLQAEDRSQHLRDEIDRYKEYLKEVERLERLQKGIRGQTEAGLDQQRLAKSQEATEKRAGDLSDKIQSDNEADAGAEEAGDSPSEGSPSEAGNTEDTPSEGSPSEGSPSEGSPSEGSPSEGSEGSPSEGSPSEGPSEGSPSEGGRRDRHRRDHRQRDRHRKVHHQRVASQTTPVAKSQIQSKTESSKHRSECKMLLRR